MQLIYIAGNTGSGKTSLISTMAERRPWFAAADPSPPLDYMSDLFADPARWAYETQVAFLISKAAAILNIPKDVENAMVDRSIYEHAEVFAKSFRDSGAIANREYHTYQELYDLIIKSLPAPRLIILCSCGPDVSERRVRLRNRPTDRLMTAEFINDIDRRLRAWACEVLAAPIYSLDTEKFDVRESGVAETVACDIERLMEQRDGDCEVLHAL